METVSATEAKNRLAQVMKKAEKAPVVIEKNGKPYMVMMSAEEYEEYIAAERKKAAATEEFLALCERLGEKSLKNGMTEEILNSILNDE